MTPFEIVVPLFGNQRRLAKLLGIDASAVCRWAKPKSQKGGDGNVPYAYHRRLLELAREQGKWLTLEDLCFGRPDFPPAKNVEISATESDA